MIRKLLDVAVENPIQGNEGKGIILAAVVVLVVIAIVVIYRLNHKE
ncbi:MAG: hypothetical protein Q4G58_11370 [bacterium]|nr:hypothetical protein [bacterium]